MAGKTKKSPKSSKKAPKKTPKPKPSKKAPPKPVFKAPPTFASVKKRLSKVNPAYLGLLKKLQDRRDEITGQVDHLEKELRDEMADNQNTPGDIADHGSGELNQHLSVTLMENDRVELEHIERAVLRIEEGVYGQCESCGKTISLERLRAIPWAVKCINCQSQSEGA